MFVLSAKSQLNVTGVFSKRNLDYLIGSIDSPLLWPSLKPGMESAETIYLP